MTKQETPDETSFSHLQEIVGPSGYRAKADAQRYFEDPRGRFTGQASLVLLPESTEQVSEIIRHCNETAIPVIPYGGGTGVVAGQLCLDDRAIVIISLERMNKIRSVLARDYAMVVEAGCILENIHDAAGEHDLMFPLSMASKGSCTIGGNLATNAGGIQVLRYGNARDLCLGIEAVLPSGEIIRELSPLRKNNTGYDLRHLLIGSEGTLGIITAATLELRPANIENLTALCAVGSPAGALQVYRALRRDMGENINGLELLSDFGLALVNRHFPNLRNPLANPAHWYLLVECSGDVGSRERSETALGKLMERELISDAVIAESETQRENLWRLRENLPEANRLTGAFCNSDTSVPISQVDGFIALTHKTLVKIHPGLRTNSYGHIGDGNIHHNVFPPAGISKVDFLDKNPGISDEVRHVINDVTVQFGGSISAEHGIGRLKPSDLVTNANPAKLNTIKAVKNALDPNNIMNPGAIIGAGLTPS